MIEYLRLAIINLKEKRLRSWLTLIGIFIGVAAVVSLMGLGDGFRTAITSQFGISSTDILSVQAGGITGAGPPGTGVVNPLTHEDVDAIKRLPSVDNAVARIIQSAKLEFNDRTVFGLAMSIPDGEDRKLVYEILNFKTEEGRLLKDGDTGKVVLGYNFFADKVGLGKPVRVGNSVLIQGRKFEVVGITKKKGSFILDNIVHMQEKELIKLFKLGDEVDIIGVLVKDESKIGQAKEDIEKLLRKRRDVKKGEEDFSVQTPQAALSTLDNILAGIQIFVAIIAGISILVGALGIVNTMLTAVLERRSQIGIMKAVGARNKDIFYMFFFESGMTGLIGGLIGVVLGTLVSYFGTMEINNFVGASTAPTISPALIISALIGSFIIGSVAGILPALRASHQNPVDAMRG